MSNNFKVSLLFTGDYIGMEEYINEDVIKAFQNLLTTNTDIPVLKFSHLSGNGITVNIDNNKSSKPFVNRDGFLSYLNNYSGDKFGSVQSIEDIFGIYDSNSEVVVSCEDFAGMEITVVSNIYCKDIDNLSKCDMLLLVDSRQPDKKLNFDIISNLVRDFKGELSVYSSFDESDFSGLNIPKDAEIVKI